MSGAPHIAVVGGGLAGISAALASTRLVSSMLFGLEPTDPVTLATATTVMLVVAAFFITWVLLRPPVVATPADPEAADEEKRLDKA